MKKFLSLLVGLILIPSICFSAGSIYVTTEQIMPKLRSYQIAWTSDASGDVNTTTFRMKAGLIFKYAADPEAGVTDAYDFTLPVAWNIATSATTTRTIEWADALSGDGANLSNSADGEILDLSIQFPVPTCVATPTIANAGNAKSGTIIIYIWEE